MHRLAAVTQYAPLRLTVALAWSLLLTLLLLQGEADPVIDLGIPRGENTLAREAIFATVHLLAFGATCLFWFWALPRRLRPGKSLIAACLISTAIGIATEFLQTYTLDRHASWIDLAANIGGVLIAARLIWRQRISR